MKRLFCALVFSFALIIHTVSAVEFTVKLETVMTHDDGKFLWFHPRAAAVPGGVVMTIQKHLKISDYYSGGAFHEARKIGWCLECSCFAGGT